MKKEQILKKYKGKLLGIRLYKSVKQEFYFPDFLKIEILSNFLDELSCSECDLTPAGKAFLDEYFGFPELASLLLMHGKLKEDIGNYTVLDLTKWLQAQDPMVTSKFINESKGVTKPKQILNNK